MNENPQTETETTLQRQFNMLKEKHPTALLLFRTGDFYAAYNQDAHRASEILGINMSKPSDRYDKGMSAVTLLPHHALDIYLPKLIRAGERVAICDRLEEQKQAIERSAERQSTEEEQGYSRGMRR